MNLKTMKNSNIKKTSKIIPFFMYSFLLLGMFILLNCNDETTIPDTPDNKVVEAPNIIITNFGH